MRKTEEDGERRWVCFVFAEFHIDRKKGLPHRYLGVAPPTSEIDKICDNIRATGKAGSVPIFRFVHTLYLDYSVASKIRWASSSKHTGVYQHSIKPYTTSIIVLGHKNIATRASFMQYRSARFPAPQRPPRCLSQSTSGRIMDIFFSI